MAETASPVARREAKPRIALVSPFLDRKHGTESRVLECMERLAEDYEFHVFSSRLEDTDVGRVRWHRVPWLPGPHLVAFLWWLVANHAARWWAQKRDGCRYDLVYTPGTNCLNADAVSVHILFAQLVRQAGPNLRFSKNPVTYWPRLVHRRLYYRLIRLLEKSIYSRPGLPLAVISQKTIRDLQTCYGRTNGMRVVYHGLDLAAFSPHERLRLRPGAREAFGYAEGDFVVLLIGNDLNNKGLPCLLEAARQAGPQCKILVAGDDDARPYRERIQQFGMNARVKFVPTRPDVNFYYAAADVYAGPSLEDAFALPPAEAMACGLPVIVSRQAGVCEIVTHGVDGFILEDAHDSAALAALLRSLAEDAPRREKIGRAAADTAQSFTWERSAAEMKRFLEEALEQKRRAKEPSATP